MSSCRGQSWNSAKSRPAQRAETWGAWFGHSPEKKCYAENICQLTEIRQILLEYHVRTIC